MRRPLVLSFAAATVLVQAQPHPADVVCARVTGQHLVYDCEIRLSAAAVPADGAVLMVGADMPSMPMAHHVKPVRATPTDAKDVYRARLSLEMAGTWMLSIRLAGATPDHWIRVPQRFGD